MKFRLTMLALAAPEIGSIIPGDHAWTASRVRC